MTASPEGRWFQWSLRTLFVAMTVLCLWLGWNVNQVQQRRALLLWLNENGGWSRAFNDPAGEPPDVCLIYQENEGHYTDDWAGVLIEPPISQFRAWLGDKPVATIALPPDSGDDAVLRAQGLFPEALGFYVILKPEYPERMQSSVSLPQAQ